jgi:adenylate cyclase
MSENMEPEDVSEILNRHLTEMAGIVIGNGGTIDKFIGDSLMAFWGAPLDDDNQALHACETALQMQQAMKQMRQDFQKAGLPQIYMRVGIHTGPAVVGNMGSVHRFDYTAVGDAVNLASRLEGINKIYGSGILLSEDTANELGRALPMWHVDKICVKGKSRPMEIYTLAESTHHADQIENAINAYREREWDRAEIEWKTLADIPAVQLLANVYLARIRDFRNEPPPPDWDGSYAFDKM